MKKLFSMMACCAFLGLLAGCGGKKESHSKSHKKSMSHKKDKSVHKSHGKKKVSEVDKIWCDICNMWTGKGHRH